MCRRAQLGRVAMLVCGTFVWLLIIQPAARGQSIAAKHAVYLPAVIAATSPAPTVELEAVTLINQQRAAHGCPPVQLNHELSYAAQQHSQEMADKNYFGHTGQDGSTFVQRAKRANYQLKPSGEIIAGGQPTAAAVVTGWMNSDAHRRIILTCANTDIGIAEVNNPNSHWGYYWTAVFGAA